MAGLKSIAALAAFAVAADAAAFQARTSKPLVDSVQKLS